MSHPETDQDFRRRILKVIQPDLRSDAMMASGYGLDSLGSLCRLERKGLPEGERVNPIVEAFRIVEQERALEAAIVALAPGERPTEPGWFVVRWGDERPTITYCVPHVFPWNLTFIARIFPDRIEGREG